jgi:hypothetical protein
MKKYIDKYGVSFVYILIFSIILLFFIWVSYDYQDSIKNNLLSESRLVANQILAMKNYIRYEQNTINTDSKGGYEFKGVHSDGAVKRIGSIIEGATSYFMIRQVSLNPRNDDSGPDRFEAKRLNKFKDDPGILELYGSGSIGGHKVFRYMIPLRADNSCIPCHGSKKGETDITGHKKEGYQVGDLIGALSVVIRSYDKYQALRRNMSILLIFIFILTLSIGLIINSLKNHFNERLAEVVKMEKVVTETVTSDTFNTKLNEKFHRLLMHNLRNPIGEIVDSAEIFKDVPLNILEESLAASNKISGYSSKLIELKKLEQGKCEILLDKFDITSAIKPKLKKYEATARKKSVQFEYRAEANMPIINSDKNLILKAIDYVFLAVLKFTSKETGKINVSLGIESENYGLLIKITNNAKRISGNSENLIFEKFADIKDINERLIFNTGVEFTTAKLLLNKLGSELSFNVNNKDNNEFCITIPIMPREKPV